jgi:hypothetical protein
MPAMAARALRVRCKASGTLPNCIARDMCSAYLHVHHMPTIEQGDIDPVITKLLIEFGFDKALPDGPTYNARLCQRCSASVAQIGTH